MDFYRWCIEWVWRVIVMVCSAFGINLDLVNAFLRMADAITEKPHYIILDALRGIAALMVVVFHLFEAHATSHLDQIINHGYLAVDFFFLLSGYVIAYAYDDRWATMSMIGFIKRRLIRLHPMIIAGMVIGAACYYFQESVIWPLISSTSLLKLLLVMIIGFTLFPVWSSMEIRGWTEMHPLNGPAWTLFFEYIANLAYALFLRRLPTLFLFLLSCIAAVALIDLAIASPQGDVIGGWSIEATQFRIGLTRLTYPFVTGLLLSRVTQPTKINHAFILCGLLLIIALAMPRIGGSQHLWMNGLYDALTIIIIFPLIVYVGASGRIEGSAMNKVSKFLGNISYPIYITHYPLIYIYIGWVADTKTGIGDAWPITMLTFFAAVGVAYVCFLFYDVPVRKWLTEKLMKRKVPAD